MTAPPALRSRCGPSGRAEPSDCAAAAQSCILVRVSTAETRPDAQMIRPADDRWFTRPRGLGLFLLLTSIVGFLSSFELVLDKFRLLADPNVVLSCDLNPFFSCGNVMTFPQSELFGFPNQLLGVFAYGIPLLLGVLLLSRVEVPHWIMNGLALGLLGGVLLVTYLQYASIIRIGVGCPWCMIVWVVAILQFCVVVASNILRGTMGPAAQASTALRTLASMPVVLGCLWLLVVATVMVVNFWTYFGSFI